MTNKYFYVVMFIVVYQVIIAFKSVDETLVCVHSNETNEAVLSLILFITMYKVFMTF